MRIHTRASKKLLYRIHLALQRIDLPRQLVLLLKHRLPLQITSSRSRLIIIHETRPVHSQTALFRQVPVCSKKTLVGKIHFLGRRIDVIQQIAQILRGILPTEILHEILHLDVTFHALLPVVGQHTEPLLKEIHTEVALHHLVGLLIQRLAHSVGELETERLIRCLIQHLNNLATFWRLPKLGCLPHNNPVLHQRPNRIRNKRLRQRLPRRILKLHHTSRRIQPVTRRRWHVASVHLIRDSLITRLAWPQHGPLHPLRYTTRPVIPPLLRLQHILSEPRPVRLGSERIRCLQPRISIIGNSQKPCGILSVHIAQSLREILEPQTVGVHTNNGTLGLTVFDIPSGSHSEGQIPGSKPRIAQLAIRTINRPHQMCYIHVRHRQPTRTLQQRGRTLINTGRKELGVTACKPGHVRYVQTQGNLVRLVGVQQTPHIVIRVEHRRQLELGTTRRPLG